MMKKKLLLPLLLSVYPSLVVLADSKMVTPHSNSTAELILKQSISKCDISQVKEFLDLGMAISPDVIEEALKHVNRTYWHHTMCKIFCVGSCIAASLGVVWSGFTSWKSFKSLEILRDKLFPWYKNVIRRGSEGSNIREQGYFFSMKVLEGKGLLKDVIKRIYGWDAEVHEFVTSENFNRRKPFFWQGAYVGPINKQDFIRSRNPLENNRLQNNPVRLDNFKEWFSKLNKLGYFSDNYYERVVSRRYVNSFDMSLDSDLDDEAMIPDQTEASFADPYYPPNWPEHTADINMLAEHERIAESLGAQYSLRGGRNLSDYFNVLEYVTHPQDKDKINTWPLLGKMLTIPGLAVLGSTGLALVSYCCFKVMRSRHDTACQIAQLVLSHPYRSISPEIQTKYKRTLDYLQSLNV